VYEDQTTMNRMTFSTVASSGS